MKKTISILAAVAVCLSAFFGWGIFHNAAAVDLQRAEYTVYNTTGAKLTELYLYDTGSADKGENLASDGIADGESLVIIRDASEEDAKAAAYTLEFTAEGMDAQKFETLHFEVAPISLKSVDAASGATPVAFAAP